MDAPVLVALANAGRPLRPVGARKPVTRDPFENAASATRMLREFLRRPVVVPELDGLRRLARDAKQIAESLLRGTTPSPHGLNRLAIGCVGHAQLRVGPAGAFEEVVLWEPGPAAAVLARRIIEELGGIEQSRLRRCARPECNLIFYDTSRSNTQRWHSEIPCGWRERQRRRRSRRKDERESGRLR